MEPPTPCTKTITSRNRMRHYEMIPKRYYLNSKKVYYIYGVVVITITIEKITFTAPSYTIYDQKVL